MLIRSFAVITAQIVLAAFAIVAFAGAAEAAFITFVASNGNDANPCTVVTAPCKTLTRAYSVTTANGTIRVLTPLQSNLFIAKNITVEGNGAAIVGFVVIANANAVVTLRGLALNGVGGFANGIRIDSAAAVHIENCTVERYTGDGIKLSASTATKLFVSNTVSRDNGNSGLLVNDVVTAQVTVDDSRFERNSNAGLYLISAKANVSRSIASENNFGMVIQSKATITETTAANNASHGLLVNAGGVATLKASVVSGSSIGLDVEAGASATITDSVFTYNGTGIVNAGTASISNSVIASNTSWAFVNSGTLQTRQNNTLGGSTSGPAAIPFSAY